MGRKWSQWERELLQEKYPDNRTVDIIHLFDRRTYGGVTGQAALMGIKKSSSFFEKEISGRMTSSRSIANQFKKGHEAWNKGKRAIDYMRPEQIEVLKKTQFKKGIKPHNTVPIGHRRVTVDGYIEVKVRDSLVNPKNKNFELLQRIVWEKHNGPIQKGSIILFKDGDKMNCDIDNLQLITKRENMLRNVYSDVSIVKRMFKIIEPEMIEKFIKENKSLIEQKRRTMMLNAKINKHNARSSK